MHNEKQFIQTMIETIKYDDYEDKNDLLTILRNSIITFNKTSNFTKKSWQYYENIELRVPIPMLNIARKYVEKFEKVARDIYLESDDYDVGTLNIKPKLIELDAQEIKEHNVYFNEIKDTIIQGIRNANYSIWVAVAWFTDKDLFNELLRKKQNGLEIRIITSDEKSNKCLFNDLQNDFEVVSVPIRGWNDNNRFHDKFCIIDFDYVMHGSYNWSKNAQSNDETWATAIDKDFVRKFADEFIRLFNQYKSNRI